MTHKLNIVGAARLFAIAAHGAIDQRRKYTHEPYIVHPGEVVMILLEHGIECPEILAAAWLHDVVEDTAVTIDTICDEFGEEVAILVAGLTDVSKPEDGNRAARKEIDRKHTSAQSPDCKTIKLADLISNTRSIVERDPEFAKIYLAEKRLLLHVLTEGNAALWDLASRLAGGDSVRCRICLDAVCGGTQVFQGRVCDGIPF
jgi:(p)ppGpp synthase/HD superfamily hydrolase